MRHPSHGVLAAVLGLLAVAAPLLAHHSISAEFDPKKERTINGVLKGVLWTNPHIVTLVNVTDPKTGRVETYSLQGNGPAGYHRAGIYKKDWVAGKPVTATFIAAKDGTKTLGFLKMLKYNDNGRILVFRVGGQ